jgi:ATP-dependent Clp protease ATP-binding subunit ClpX
MLGDRMRAMAGPAAARPDTAPKVSLEERLAAIDVQSPRRIDERLEELGYRGQVRARRAAAVLAYRHLRRLKRLHLDGEVADPGTRQNCLFLGPTGCGKTYLVELLFRSILEVPTVMVDATQFSETGYVGDDVNTILSRLLAQAGGDLDWASCGVVCMDEFDKLATSRSDARFAGQQTTKDVSGFGVQRGLLSLLSAQKVDFPPDFGFTSRQPPLTMPMAGITFIACGAFSGFKGVVEGLDGEERIGFGHEVRARLPDAIAAGIMEEELAKTTAFARYGFVPELIGRFNRLVAFAPLDADTLKAILEGGILAEYQREFAAEGMTLVAEDSVLDHVVDQALLRETGGRGLRAELSRILEDAAYEHFGQQNEGEIRLRLHDGAIFAEAV